MPFFNCKMPIKFFNCKMPIKFPILSIPRHTIVFIVGHSVFPNFYHFKWKIWIYKACLPPPHFSQPLVTTSVLFVLMDLPMLNISYKQNHTIFVLLLMIYFTQHKVFLVHPVVACPSFLWLNNTLLYVYTTCFVKLIIC